MTTYALIANRRRIESLLARARVCKLRDIENLFEECASAEEVIAVMMAQGAKARERRRRRDG